MSAAQMIEHSIRVGTAGVRAGIAAKGVLIETGQQSVTQVKANASGRPGPRVITGAYRGSWNGRLVSVGPFEGTWSTGSNAPQGPRLEHGFVGADVTGRVYNQPPFPHVRPMVEKIAPLFAKRMARVGVEAVER